MKDNLAVATLLMVTFALSGCAPMVGGPCEYRTSVDLAHVEKAENNFKLILHGSHLGHHHLAYPFDKAAKKQAQNASAKVGDVWHVIVNEQTKGTCTPLSVSLFQRASADTSAYNVYFSDDSSDPSPAEKDMIAAFAERHARCEFHFEGHTDEIGSREYNLHLAQRMADSVAQVMRDYGIAKNKLKTVSFGEERPQNASKDADTRHALNRRVEIIARCEKN